MIETRLLSGREPNRKNGAPIRVLVVASPGLLRTGLRLMLEEESRIAVVGEADTCMSALECLGENPDVVLVDLDNGVALEPDGLAHLAETRGDVRILILASDGNDDAQVHAMRSGAMGIVFKERSPEALKRAIERVFVGETCFDRSVIVSAFRKATRSEAEARREEPSGIAELTPREREVVTLAARGLRNKKIAAKLFISEVTVRHHLTSIFGKLGVSDRLDLMRFALKNGLASLPEEEVSGESADDE